MSGLPTPGEQSDLPQASVLDASELEALRGLNEARARIEQRVAAVTAAILLRHGEELNTVLNVNLDTGTAIVKRSPRGPQLVEAKP